jgi:hypothetical protein
LDSVDRGTCSVVMGKSGIRELGIASLLAWPANADGLEERT